MGQGRTARARAQTRRTPATASREAMTEAAARSGGVFGISIVSVVPVTPIVGAQRAERESGLADVGRWPPTGGGGWLAGVRSTSRVLGRRVGRRRDARGVGAGDGRALTVGSRAKAPPATARQA